MSKFIAICLLLGLYACNSKPEKAAAPDLVSEKISLLKADKAFSEMSVRQGMKAAFLEFIDSNGVLLRPGSVPIVGADAVDFLISQDDATYSLNWQPQNAVVAKAADLGYTYGIYALHPKAVDTVLYGTYLSIWKKQGDGSWRFVLDTGNEGIDSAAFDF